VNLLRETKKNKILLLIQHVYFKNPIIKNFIKMQTENQNKAVM